MDSAVNKFSVLLDYEKDNPLHSVTTPIVGGGDFWVITDGNALCQVHTKHIVRLPFDGVTTFLRSSCMTNMSKHCT